MRSLKIALVHDWLINYRGGEKVLEILCELLPQADVYTLLVDENKIPRSIYEKIKGVSFLQKIYFARKHHHFFLPLFPMAMESMVLKEDYDIIISSSHCVAKGVKKPENSLHICYCYTPMRYIWVFFDTYFPPEKFFLRMFMQILKPYLMRWDLEKNKYVDYFVSISYNVQERIRKYYHRDSFVIHPPVDTDFFFPQKNQAGDFYLVVSALVPYKRVDVAVEAFNKLKKPLYIVGRGICEKELRRKALDNIKFLGWVDKVYLRRLYSSCKALIFCAEEDFGLVPLEACACGRPVICLGKGGVQETMIDIRDTHTFPTGVYFYEQTVSSLIEAVELFERHINYFNPSYLRKHALKFSRDVFKEKFIKFLQKVWNEKNKAN